MKVYEIEVKVYTLKPIVVKDSLYRISEIIDRTLAKKNEFLEFHNKNIFKNYTFNSLYPIEKDGIYKKDKIYTFRIRSVDENLINYLKKTIHIQYTNSLKVLTTNVIELDKNIIQRIYSITPIVIKTESGYWRNCISIDEFQQRLRNNLIKKYNNYFNRKIDEKFSLYNYINLDNNAPIASKYKNISILGDKITMNICKDSISQELIYFALGVGLGEMNSRGFGFINYK